ncbi:MAG: protein O-mannosyl-transferase family [Pseudomonadota bacterium]
MSRAGTPPANHQAKLVFLVILVAMLALYGLTLPRTITLEDAGLFHSVCFTGGLAHPPGYPLFTLICTPLYSLPFSPVIIGNSISAVFGALTSALLGMVLLTLGCRPLAALFGGLMLGVSASFWSQAIIIEVYTLNTALFAATLWMCLKFARTPAQATAWLACLGVGLGLSNHWPLTVLAAPGLLVLVLSQWRWLLQALRQPIFLAGCISGLLLGLTPYLSLLLKQHPVVSYQGPLDSFADFIRYVSRQDYKAADVHAGASIVDKVQFLGWLAQRSTQQVVLLALPLVPLAIAVGFRQHQFVLHAALALVFVMNTAMLVALLGFDYQFSTRAIFEPYPLIAWCCLAVWLGLGLDWLIRRMETHGLGTPAVRLYAASVLVLTLAQNFTANSRSDAWIANEYSQTLLKLLPANALLVVKSDALSFTLLYQHLVAGLRPDIDLYQFDNVGIQRLSGSVAERRAWLLAQASTRPVFSAGVPEMPAEAESGFWNRQQGSGQMTAEREPGFDQVRRRIIVAYAYGALTNAQEKLFASEVLLGIANNLVTRAADGTITPVEAEDLALLQRTFPGVLFTLYGALALPGFSIETTDLLTLALDMEANLPEEARNQDRALFYYYLALLFTQGKRNIAPDAELAQIFLLKGFEVMPTLANPGLCLLQQIGAPAHHLSGTPAFLAHCRT